MRKLFLLGLMVLVAACRGTQPYSAQDLEGVKAAKSTVIPVYLQFKQDYKSNDPARIQQGYAREQRACKQVDVIDKRDTIDPNVNLFQASAQLDDFCNAIESAYTYWAKKHGLPYDKILVPGRHQEVFIQSDADLLTIQKYMRHPAALS